MLLRMGEFFSTILSLFLKNLVALHWMNSGGNVVSPAELRKHYDFRWLRLPEDTI